jgi:hypothetical protein
LKADFKAADKVITDMGLTWPTAIGAVIGLRFGWWLASIALGLAQIAGHSRLVALLLSPVGIALLAAIGAGAGIAELSNRYMRPDEGADPEEYFNKRYGEGWLSNFMQWNWRKLKEEEAAGLRPMSGEETPKSDPEKRADLDEKRRNDKELTSEFKTLAYDLTKLNDRLMPGGPEGGKGPSGFQNDLSPGAFQTMMKGGVFADQYQAVVDAAENHGLPPSLMASILAFETGYGKSGKSQPPYNNPAGLMAGGLFNREHMKFPTLGEGIDKAGEVQKRIYEQGGRAIAGMASIYAPVGAKNDPHRTNVQWPGSVTSIQNRLADRGFDPGGLQGATFSGFDPGGLQDAVPGVGSLAAGGASFSPITSYLAKRDRAIGGTATVDIDIGGLGQSARDPNELFPPRLLGGAVQMENTTRQVPNPQSFQ